MSAGCMESKMKDENCIVSCNSATPEVMSDPCKSGTTFVYHKDNEVAAPPPSAMMYSYAPSATANAVAYNPLAKSACFNGPDRSTSGYPTVYGDDVTNRMYLTSSSASSITSLADAYLIQATLPHLQQPQHPHQIQHQVLHGTRRVYGSGLVGFSSTSGKAEAADPVELMGSGGGADGGRDHLGGINGPSTGHLPLSAQPQSAGLMDSASNQQFLPSISEFGSVARLTYC